MQLAVLVFFFSSELVGVTPSYSSCFKRTIYHTACSSSFFFSSELVGVTPHTVRCNISKELFIMQLAVLFFFSSELAGVTPHTVQCNNSEVPIMFLRNFLGGVLTNNLFPIIVVFFSMFSVTCRNLMAVIM